VEGKTVRILVKGKGTFSTSAGLREFAKEMINRGHRQFLIDIKSCSMMDSTFMGTLAGIGLHLKELGQGNVVICNSNERNESLLRNLGLDHLLTITNERAFQAPGPDHMEQLPQTKSDNAETVLEAHEALVQASPSNLERFKDVLDYLRQDLKVNPPG
jgi:anti-anti-sigma regulatory factor